MGGYMGIEQGGSISLLRRVKLQSMCNNISKAWLEKLKLMSDARTVSSGQH